MKQLRQNTFETNSSSSHSVTIKTYGKFDDIPAVNDYLDLYHSGEFVLKGDKFGWEVRDYDDFDTKLRYVVTLACMMGKPDLDDNHWLSMICEVLSANIKGADSFKLGNDYYDWYIDHQSYEYMAEDIFQSKNTLASFLFCSKSILRIDNDNH